MRSLSGVGLGLSLVFGCLLLALVGELYYLLWWKKRIIITNREIEVDYSSPAREFLYTFCCKKPSSLSSTALDPQQLSSSLTITDTHVHESQAHQDFWLKPFGEDTELMRLQSLSGPPRLLFTINEETKEDLESEDDKSRKVETPFLTPLASPPYFTPPLTPMDSSFNNHKCNPKFESSSDAEFNRIRSSPPPKFKFLRDAEEKLYRRTMMDEADQKGVHVIKAPPSTSMILKDEENGSSVTLIVAN